MEDNEVESLKARVQLIIDEEALMTKSELENPRNFPPFIQVLQAHRTPEPAWAGLGGKMATEVQKIDEKVDLMQEQVGHIAEVEGKVEKIDEKVDRMQEQVGHKVDKLACEITELKELLMEVLESKRSSEATRRSNG